MNYVLGVLIALLLASGVGNFIQWNNNTLLADQKALVDGSLETAKTNASTNKQSADKWEALAGELRDDLAECNETKQTIADENRAAVAKAQTGAKDAAEKLRQFRAKYDAASKDATCAALLDLPLCEELQ